jgi:signal transduction histidine kinase
MLISSIHNLDAPPQTLSQEGGRDETKEMAMAIETPERTMTTVTATPPSPASPGKAANETLLAEPMHTRERTVLACADDDLDVDGHAIAQDRALQRLEERLGITAHELRSPMTSGKLAVQLAMQRLYAIVAETGTSDDLLASKLEPLRDLLIRAESSLDRLNRLVDDLTDVARIRNGALALRLDACDVIAVVRETVEEQRLLAPGRVVRLEVPASPIPYVLADSDRIRQVVTNYVVNALRYAPAERPIDVKIRWRGNRILVAVCDEGPGVPSDQRRRIWERFERGSGKRDAMGVVGVDAVPEPHSGLGLGLGLHICKAIVQQHEGKVGLRTAPGHGSMFWFALPIFRSAE